MSLVTEVSLEVPEVFFTVQVSIWKSSRVRVYEEFSGVSLGKLPILCVLSPDLIMAHRRLSPLSGSGAVGKESLGNNNYRPTHQDTGFHFPRTDDLNLTQRNVHGCCRT